FFFRAEDVIRYCHVTGVQTCALPISRSSLASAQKANGSTARARHRWTGSRRQVRTSQASARAASAGRASAARTPLTVGPVPLWKIGRASCRERGEGREQALDCVGERK